MEDNWCHYSGMPSPKSYVEEAPVGIKKGDWILYNSKRKKCFGIHFNGNILIKMNNTIVQVSKEKINRYDNR
tara:strand:- start:346 stop:561 length:216 start_codon:yes stop_codon:yes gene_type:complete